MKYFVYIVQCSDNTFYTGYTTDLIKRIEHHNTKPTGARYTQLRRPVKLAFYEIFSTQKDAMIREKEIKKLTRDKKVKLVEDFYREQLSITDLDMFHD